MLKRESLVHSDGGEDLLSSPGDDLERSQSGEDAENDAEQVSTSTPAPPQVSERQRGHVGHTDEELQEMRKYDLRRVKRIMANRSSAARSKVRKLRYTNELDSRISALSNEHRSLQEECYAIQAGVEILNRENEMLNRQVDELRAANLAADVELRPLKQTAHILRQRMFGPLSDDSLVDLPSYINLPEPEQLHFPQRMEVPAVTSALSGFTAPPPSLNSRLQQPNLHLGLPGELTALGEAPALNPAALPSSLSFNSRLGNPSMGMRQQMGAGNLGASGHLGPAANLGPHLGVSNLQLRPTLPHSQAYSLSHLQQLSNHLSNSSTGGSGRSSLTALYPQAGAADDPSLLSMLQSMDLTGDLHSLQSDVSTQSGRLNPGSNWTGLHPSLTGLSGIEESRGSSLQSLQSLPPLDRSLWNLMAPGATETPALFPLIEQDSFSRHSGGPLPSLGSPTPQGLSRFHRANSAPHRTGPETLGNPWSGPWRPPQPQRMSAEQLQHPWAFQRPPHRDL